ncbi:hypothetical protein Tco_0277826 [Tanacetum coccineum]
MATQSSSATTGVGSSSTSTIVQIVPTTRNPKVWKHYNLCKMMDRSTKAQCKHCFHFLAAGSNSTLRNHFKISYCEALKMVSKAGQSSMARDGCFFVYNPDVVHEQFAGLVIQEGLPLNHFDNSRMMREFQNHIQPKYNHISHTTLKRDAMKSWKAVKQHVKNSFFNLNASVNITTNVLSAPHGLPSLYLCVTAHWIEPETCTWKAFGGNTRDLGLILEETGQDCNFTQRILKELLTEGGDGVKIPCDAVWNCKRQRQNSCDGVRTYTEIDINYAAGGNLRRLSAVEAWETIEDCAQCDKQ